MGSQYRRNVCTAGMSSWSPDQDSALLFESFLRSWGMICEPQTTDEIAAVWPVICAAFDLRNCIALEVFDITNGPPVLSALSTSSFFPASDLFSVNAFRYGSVTGFLVQAVAANGFQVLDNPVLTPAIWPISGRYLPHNEFMTGIFGIGYEYAFKPGGISGFATGRWVTRLRLVWTAARFEDLDAKCTATWQPYIQVNGLRYFGPPVTSTSDGAVEVTTDWYVNPATGLPWTAADVDAFDSGSGGLYGFGWVVSGTGSANSLPLLLQARVDVESAPTDERVAIGSVCPNPKQGWQRIVLRDTDTGSPTTFTFTPGDRWLFAFRGTVAEPNGLSSALCRLDDPGNFLEGTPTWSSADLALDAQSHRLRGIGEEDSILMGLALETTAGIAGSTFSLDSQAYATTTPEGLDIVDAWPNIDAYFRMSPVDVTHTIYQQFTPPMTGNYGWLQIKLCLATPLSDGDLTVVIRDNATHTDQHTPIVITPDDLDPVLSRQRWQTYGVALAVPVALVAGTRYYFAIESQATHQQGWLVQVANGGMSVGPPTGPPLGMHEVTFGGDDTPANVLILQVDGVNGAWPTASAEVAIAIRPDPPTGLTVTLTDDGCGNPGTLIEWENPTIVTCGGFEAAEVEALYTGSDWQAICHITDELVEAFEDFQPHGGKAVSYRVRAIRGDGIPSPYTSTVTVTAEAPECGLSLTSNEAPELNLWFPDVQGFRKFGYPRNETVYQPFDRDFNVVYSELENRGVTFTATFNVRPGRFGTDGQPCFAGCEDIELTGESVFQPLKDLIRADLSYVCTRNEAGDRWFMHLTLDSSMWDPEANVWTADVSFVEVTGTSCQPDSAVS